MNIKTTTLTLIALAATALPAHATQLPDSAQCLATITMALTAENAVENVEGITSSYFEALELLNESPITDEIRETGNTIVYEFKKLADLWSQKSEEFCE